MSGSLLLFRKENYKNNNLKTCHDNNKRKIRCIIRFEKLWRRGEGEFASSDLYHATPFQVRCRNEIPL